MTIETQLKNLIIKNLRIILMIFNNKKLTGPKTQNTGSAIQDHDSIVKLRVLPN